MIEHDPDQYAKGRAMFDHILDSFNVRELTPEESAAIVNPEPIEIKPEHMTEVDKKGWVRYNQALIDRLNRDKSADD